MAFVPVEPWRSVLIDTDDERLFITVFLRRPVRQFTYLLTGAAIWAAGAIGAVRELSVYSARREWVTFCLVLWIAWGAYALLKLPPLVCTREFVVVDSGVLSLRRELLRGVGLSRTFRVEQIRAMRHEPPPSPGVPAPPSRGWPPPPLPRLGGSIHFEYCTRSYTFALGVDANDIAIVLAALREKVPRAGWEGAGTPADSQSPRV